MKSNQLMKMKSKTAQIGLSLIELMVAMTLGLILLGGIIQIFLSSKQSYSSVMNSSQVLDNGRLALHFMSAGISKAGFWGTPSLKRTYGADAGLIADQYTGVFEDGQWVFGRNNDSTNANVVDGTDELFIRFHGAADIAMTTCNGNDVDEDQMAIERYFIRIPGAGENLPSLVCESTILDFSALSGANTVPGTISTSSTVLMAGVENMQLQFGFRQKDDDVNNIRFLTANNVVLNDWPLIESVKLAVLATSSDEVNQVVKATGFSMLDITTAAPTDRRARRVFQQALMTRNSKVPNSF